MTASSPAWQLILSADLMTKFVLLFLFCLSVFCIWIVISKFLLFRSQNIVMQKFKKRMCTVNSFDDILAVSKEFKTSLGGKFLTNSLGCLKALLKTEKNTARLSEKNAEYLSVLIEQEIDAIISQEELYLPVLGTSAAVSPLIGLFGTVWGLVHAFLSIGISKSADISVVAPGIAEALMTTLAGLIVAIPAMIFFHYFSNELRKVEHDLLKVSDTFLNLVKQTFMS